MTPRLALGFRHSFPRSLATNRKKEAEVGAQVPVGGCIHSQGG